MITKGFPTEQVAVGWLLISSFLIFTVGGLLYTGRAIWKLPAGQSYGYLVWERGFVMAALVVALMGLALLGGLLKDAGDGILAPCAMVLMLIGGGAAIFGETYFVGKQAWIYAPIVVFVILAFIGQAVFGASLLRTGLLPAWMGWATILWNLAWLVILPVASPREIYYPWLHYVAPLMIGIGLLLAK